MGQRLVIDCVHNNKVIATLYYHWSAYSRSALYEAKHLVDFYKQWKECGNNDLALALIRFVESEGGCIDGGEGSEEWEYITNIYPKETFNATGNRSNGLIALSDKGREGAWSWADGTMMIDFDSEVIENSVFDYYANVDEWNAIWCDDDDKEDYIDDINKLPKLEVDLETIGFDDIEYTYNYLANNNTYRFRTENNEIIGLIA